MKRISAEAIPTSRNLSVHVPDRASVQGRTAWAARKAGLVLLAAALTTSVYGQAPAVLWSTNIGARLFAVDEQTNIYANVGGTVIKLSRDGVPIQTNAVCPVNGNSGAPIVAQGVFAQQDAAGNYYFAGGYTPPQDFGGVTLTNSYNVFVAKYSPAGALIWAQSQGPALSQGTSVTDLRVEPAGSVYVGYGYNSGNSHYEVIDALDSTGANLWHEEVRRIVFSGGSGFSGKTRLGVATSSNVCALVFLSPWPFSAWSVSLDRVGADHLSMWDGKQQPYSGNIAWAARPIQNAQRELYSIEGESLTRRTSGGALLWAMNLGNSVSWTVGEDQFDGVHVADNNGILLRFDIDGNQAWSLTNASAIVAMVVDENGNRFFSMANGDVARLGAEQVTGTQIITPPQGQTVFAGSNAALSVAATGSAPLRYYWLRDGVLVTNGPNATLSLPNVTPAQAGNYTVIVSNFVHCVTSSPALLRVKQVAIFAGDQLLTNGNYIFTTPPMLTVRSAFPNGSVFYTLDGSPPSFASTYYTGSIPLPQSATVRAIGYSADFMQSEEADAVTATVLVNHTLTASASSGGSVTLSPPGGTYLSTNTVLATGVPAPGWSFLYWLGDAIGTNPSLNVTMERDKALHAVFGTTLSTTAAGNGQVLFDPPGGVYPYGMTVRLTAVPQPGNYFGFWGNATSGNSNPLYFTVTSPTQTVSSIFGATSSGQAALTVRIAGHGRVNRSPQANAYTLNQSVTLTAVPEAGQNFVGWSGDASGTQSSLVLTMDAAKEVTATFTARPSLRADRAGIEGLTSAGFRFTLVSDLLSAYEVLASTNLSVWESAGWVTNVFGEVQFTDPSASGSSQKFYQARP